MTRAELVPALQRNETSSLGSLLLADPRLAKRFGLGVKVVGGVVCITAGAFPIPLLHRAIGFGTLGDATQATLDRIVRTYAARELPARVEIAEQVASAGAVRLLERNGFRREKERHRIHVLETSVAPAAPDIRGLDIRRGAPAEFGKAVRVGFAATGDIGLLFERASATHLRAERGRAIGLVPVVGGRVAGSALLWLSPRVAGLYAGSVHQRFRGRGIQLALIAERIRLGLARRRRIFTSQTDADNASAHNLRDMGFRPLYDTAYFIRETN